MNPLDRKRVIVIGGGASGLLAAGVAAGRGAQVTLLERNHLMGRKLHISGKGRCNVTNATDIPGLERNIPGNPKFLRSAFYRFGPQEAIAFFSEHEVPCKTERGGRVFPESDNADDVVHALVQFCRQQGVHLVPDVAVQHVMTADGQVIGVKAEHGQEYHADAVILATGGASYPGTGSRGDGYRMAEELGHTIIPIRPSLVPLETEEAWPAEAQGLSLRNVELTAFAPDGKKLYSDRGEMLFTHFGITGPLVLTASRHVADKPGSHITLDLKPALDEATLDARVLRDFEKFNRREFSNALAELLPRSLIPVIIKLSGIAPHTFIHQITREERLRFVHLLKHLSLTVKRPRSMFEAIITVGGVNTKEIDSRTMESKLVHGLFLTGEVIDVDGYTGGFNLQIAWSTGHLAGESV
ncbi:MAG TPA: NAD(P)/FAD-dependent oxidoreductase [Armatimonadota bacterium]|nr:NAD(P)/FAD-dependent oxidoreductase [Armatimonadota bacterium]